MARDGKWDVSLVGGGGASPGSVPTYDGSRAVWGAGPIYLEAIVKAGTAAVASNLMPPGFRVPAATTLRAVYVNVGTAPTGSGLTVVVKRSGTTLATVTVAAGATSGSDTGLSTALAKGDLLTADITAVGSTVAGSDVLVTIEAY
jgi:hypothetical protein